MNIQNFHSLLEAINSPQVAEAERAFNELIQTNPALLLQLLITSIKTFTDHTVRFAITLLKSFLNIVGQHFLEIGDENFHRSFQSSLLSLIISPITDHTLIPMLSHSISCFASLYKETMWPNLFFSLIEFLIHPETGLVQPPANSPFSAYAATEILWECINNESIILRDLGPVFSLIQAVFQNAASIEKHQLLSTAKLAFFSYSSTKNSNFAYFSVAVVGIMQHLPFELVGEYFKFISLIADTNILFLAPSIEFLLSIIDSTIGNLPQMLPSISSCVNILTVVFSTDQFYELILPRAFEFYKKIANVISQSPFEFDEEIGIRKSPSMSIAEDALVALSKTFSDSTMDFSTSTSEMFTECLSCKNSNFNYVVSNLVAFASIVYGSPQIYTYENPNVVNLIEVYRATILNPEPNLRCISVMSLNKIMKASGDYVNSFYAEILIPIIIEAISNEQIQVIMTCLLKSLKIYLTCFNDFEEFVDPLMELLGSKFGEMNEKQQIYSIYCYYQISNEMAKEKFAQFLPSIISFMTNVLSSFDSNSPLDLFFTCMEVAPKFKSLPIDQFNSIAQLIFSFIASITDISQFSSKQMDSINEAIRTILLRNPEQFLPFASSIVSFIFNAAISDYKYQSFEVGTNYSEPCYSSDSSYVVVNLKTNMIDIYSDSSINTVYEGLNSLDVLLSSISEVVKLEGFIENLINVINKVGSQPFLPEKNIAKLFSIIYKFFNLVNSEEYYSMLFESQGEAKPLSLQIYSVQFDAIIKIISRVNTLQEFENIDWLLNSFKKTFFFFSKFYFKFSSKASPILFNEILKITTMLNIFVYNKTNSVRTNVNRVTDLDDDYIDISSAEKSNGSFFSIIFAFLPSLLDEEKVRLLSAEFPIEPIQQNKQVNGLFVSPTVLSYWKYFVLLFPGCSREQARQIVLNLIDLILSTNLELDSQLLSISTVFQIVSGSMSRTEENDVGNRFGFEELFEPALQFLSEIASRFLSRGSGPILGPYLNKELVIIAQKMVESQRDPSIVINMLNSLMPFNYIYKDFGFGDNNAKDGLSIDQLAFSYNILCANSLIKLCCNRGIPALWSLESITTFVVMAALLYENIESADIRNSLVLIIKNPFSNPETAENLKKSLDAFYFGTFHSGVIKSIHSLLNK